jgi:DNA-binding MarR family transcriptional regulator
LVIDIVNDLFHPSIMKPRRPLDVPGLPPHSGGEAHLLREVMRTHRAVMGAFSRSLNMPAGRLGLLRALAVSGPDGVGPADLARHLGVNPAAVTRQLQELEREGLVARRADPHDGRRTAVRLTASGLQAFRRVHERGHALEQELGPDVTREDVATAVRVLQRLRTALGRDTRDAEDEDLS